MIAVSLSGVKTILAEGAERTVKSNSAERYIVIFLTILIKLTFSFCQQIPYSTFCTDIIQVLKARVDLLNTIERTFSIYKRISIVAACTMSSIGIVGSAKRIGSSASSSSYCIARVAF